MPVKESPDRYTNDAKESRRVPNSVLPGTEGALKTLTPNERQFLLLFVEGGRMKEIAARMGIHPRDASGFKGRVMKKLNVATWVDLVLLAIRIGLLSPGDCRASRASDCAIFQQS